MFSPLGLDQKRPGAEGEWLSTHLVTFGCVCVWIQRLSFLIDYPEKGLSERDVVVDGGGWRRRLLSRLRNKRLCRLVLLIIGALECSAHTRVHNDSNASKQALWLLHTARKINDALRNKLKLWHFMQVFNKFILIFVEKIMEVAYFLQEVEISSILILQQDLAESNCT